MVGVDKGTTLQHLKAAERQVARGRDILGRQRDVICALEKAGFDSENARQLLTQLEEAQTSHEAERDRLLRTFQRLP